MKWWRGTGERIYADAAASMPVSARALRRFNELCKLCGNPGGLHKEAVAAKEALEEARREVAAAIGAHADEIVFTSGGTESNNLAIVGTLRHYLPACRLPARSARAGEARGAGRSEGEQVHAITCAIEHPSVLEPLMHLEDEGLLVTYLPVDANGLVDVKGLREAITPRTVLVSIQMVNSEIGTIQPMREIAKAVRRARTLRPVRQAHDKQAQGDLPLYFHTDASQAPLWLSLNVEKLGIDLMTLDAQKIGGVRGAGALYVRRSAGIEPLIRGGGQERGARAGTENLALAGAFAEALTEAAGEAELRAARVSAVRDLLMSEIKRLMPDAVLNGASGPASIAIHSRGEASGTFGKTLERRPPIPEARPREERIANIINVSIPELDGEMAVIALDALGIAASTRSACGTDDEDPSYVVAAVAGNDRAREAIRFTLLPAVTKKDAVRIAEALATVAKKYRGHKA